MAKLTTFQKIDRALDAVAKEINSGRVDVAVISGAAEMLEIVKTQCPVDTGRLRDSLYIEKGGRASVRGAPGRQSHLAVENVYCTIATDVYYAWFLEYGTSKMPPHPFMRPAFDSAARPISDAIFSTVQTLAMSALAQV